MPHVEDPASAGVVEARFTCAICGREAAHLTLVPRGIPSPSRPDHDMLAAFGHRLVIDAGRLSTTTGAPGKLDAPGFARTLASADPAAIFAIDREFAPFWCPRCSAIYRAAEWRIWDVWADDHPSWWEELKGSCPNGHVRMIYD
jgi:hypothetical protein